MASWIGRWFVQTYVIHFGSQGAALYSLAWLLGYASDAERFFSENRPIVAIVLILHFICYLISAMASVDRERLDDFRRRHLDDIDE